MKKLIRKVMNLFGYDVTKVPRTGFKKEYNVQVQKYSLVMPASNPLRITYAQQKNFASELGRLVSVVSEKYPNMIFLDVGANTGDTVAMVKSYKDVPVISIEGDDFSFSYLEKNVSQFKNVTILKHFLGEKKESLAGQLQKQGWNTTIIPDKKAGGTIELTTLDDLLSTRLPVADFQKIKVLKIDTEGFDTIILRGASDTIRQARPAIFIEYNRDNMEAINEDGLSTLLNMEKSGYRKALFYDDRGRFILSTDLSNTSLIRQLHHYADGKNGLVYYYNICLFHEEDLDLAAKTVEKEIAGT